MSEKAERSALPRDQSDLMESVSQPAERWAMSPLECSARPNPSPTILRNHGRAGSVANSCSDIAGEIVDESGDLSAEERRAQDDQHDYRREEGANDDEGRGRPIETHQLEPVDRGIEQVGEKHSRHERQQD